MDCRFVVAGQKGELKPDWGYGREMSCALLDKSQLWYKLQILRNHLNGGILKQSKDFLNTLICNTYFWLHFEHGYSDFHECEILKRVDGCHHGTNPAQSNA